MASHENSPPGNRYNDADLPEVKHHEEKEYDPQIPHQEKEHVPQFRQVPVALPSPGMHKSDYDYYAQTTSPEAVNEELARKRPWWKKKRFWLPLTALILIAAVVGGVAGGLSARKSKDNSIKPSPSPTGTPNPPSPVSTQPSAPTSSATWNSSLASVAWADSEGVGYRRLYYQSAGTIKESAWNSSGGEWYSSNEALAPNAKLNSPLAAAVVGPQQNNFQLNLYFVDAGGQVVEMYAKDAQSWSRGSISNQDIAPSVNSDLAAVWTAYDGDQCNNCGEYDLIFAYQDTNNKLQVINATSSGLKYATLDADPVPGSGLAMTISWHNEGRPGIRLYYQKGENDIVSIDWEGQYYSSTGGDSAAEWTLHEDEAVGHASSGAPMASFSWGSAATSDGPLLIGVLNSGPEGHGVDETHWTQQGWQDPETPDALKNAQAYSAIAANTDRHVYTLEAGGVREFVVSTDGLSWSAVGDVLTVH